MTSKSELTGRVADLEAELAGVEAGIADAVGRVQAAVAARDEARAEWSKVKRRRGFVGEFDRAGKPLESAATVRAEREVEDASFCVVMERQQLVIDEAGRERQRLTALSTELRSELSMLRRRVQDMAGGSVTTAERDVASAVKAVSELEAELAGVPAGTDAAVSSGDFDTLQRLRARALSLPLELQIARSVMLEAQARLADGRVAALVDSLVAAESEAAEADGALIEAQQRVTAAATAVRNINREQQQHRKEAARCRKELDSTRAAMSNHAPALVG